jgi:replicative DNA helicase
VFNNIVMPVYSDTWRGGQFSCSEPGNWLYDYCQSLGDYCCEKTVDGDFERPKSVSTLLPMFTDFAKNIEKNTVKTGIDSLDESVFLTVGMPVALLGAPGSGKTSAALNILENTSRLGIKSVFVSLDMSPVRLTEKIMYRSAKIGRDELYSQVKKSGITKYQDDVESRYKNVFFMTQTGATVDHMRDYIKRCEDQSGEKIKLVVVDYFERLGCDINEDTAASKFVANALQDLAINANVCLITLYQPNKNALAGGPDSPLLDYGKIKGSSMISQSNRIILSCWRPFYRPGFSQHDKYMEMAVLKNDLGELNRFVLGFDGATSSIRELEDFERAEFNDLLNDKLRKDEEDQKVRTGWKR